MGTKRILDYNPLTGESVTFEYNHSAKKVVINHQQNVEKIRKSVEVLANDTDRTNAGIKNDMWHYARVPNIVIMEMKNKHGVDFFDRNDYPKVLQLLNTEYSMWKTTHKNHSVRHG